MKISKPSLLAALYGVCLSSFVRASDGRDPPAKLECQNPIDTFKPESSQGMFWAKIRLDPQAYHMDWPELRRGSVSHVSFLKILEPHFKSTPTHISANPAYEY